MFLFFFFFIVFQLPCAHIVNNVEMQANSFPVKMVVILAVVTKVEPQYALRNLVYYKVFILFVFFFFLFSPLFDQWVTQVGRKICIRGSDGMRRYDKVLLKNMPIDECMKNHFVLESRISVIVYQHCEPRHFLQNKIDL